MRIAAAVLIVPIVAFPLLALAQTAPAGKPDRPAAADPKKKSTPAPAGRDLGGGIAPAERVAIQLDLAWTGEYNGLINGEFNDRTIAAIKAFQKDNQLKETGTLAPPERALLAAHSKRRQDEAGWRMVDDKATGAQVGLPTMQVPNSAPGKTGTRWSSGQGQIQVETFRIREPGTTLADVFDQQKKEPPGRHLEVNLLRDDFFILSGTQGLKKFYVRAAIKDGEVRGMTLAYDRATEGIMDPAAVVMSSAFAPFPGTGIAAQIATPARRKVEYASGLIVSASGIVATDAQAIAGCAVVEVGGHGDADRVAEDPSGLALLRIFATPNLPAATPSRDAKGPDVTLVGIADPQAQAGGNAVSSVSARFDGDALQPAAPLGFDGGAGLDAQGRLLGIVTMKDSLVASAGAASPQPQTGIAPSAALVKMLEAQSITPTTERAGMDAIKAAVVRVICVRK